MTAKKSGERPSLSTASADAPSVRCSLNASGSPNLHAKNRSICSASCFWPASRPLELLSPPAARASSSDTSPSPSSADAVLSCSAAVEIASGDASWSSQAGSWPGPSPEPVCTRPSRGI
eukprot:scaffold52649_cov34-Phaeocystis_antarctica.AAC.3